MMTRCPTCRAFASTVHAPNHPPRIARHLGAEAATLVALLDLPDDVTPAERERIGAKFGWCRGSGGEAAPLLVYVAHPVAPPAVVDLDVNDREFLRRYNAGISYDAQRIIDNPGTPEIHPAVALNLANADRWYRGLLARFPHLDLVMPWRPMLDHLPDDGPAGPNRAHGLRTAAASAARCDVVLGLVKLTPGMLREAAACTATGGRLVALELGAAVPEVWPDDDDLPPELRS